MYWEDVDFGIRCRRAGYGLAIVQNASVRHARSASHAKAGGRIDRYQALGTVVMARKYGLPWIIGAVMRLTARVLKRAAKGQLRNVGQVAMGAWRGLFIRCPAYCVMASPKQESSRSND